MKILIYLLSALCPFYVFLSIEFVGFYAIFAGFVFWMDFGMEGQEGKSKGGHGQSGDGEPEKSLMVAATDFEAGRMVSNLQGKSSLFSGFWGDLGPVSLR